VNIGLTGGLGDGEGPKVEKFEIESFGDWVVRGCRWREGESPVTP